jgi:cytosine/adenosine deaminase-related metal-dependent hydrolase
MSRIFARAAWVHGRQLAYDVEVEFDNGAVRHITGAGSSHADCRVDLLLPGFINAHCHLEYTALAGKLPAAEASFGEWLDAIISVKLALPHDQVAAGITAGMQQLLAGGCTSVLDSTTQDDLSYVRHSPLKQFVLREVLGLTKERAQQQITSLQQAHDTQVSQLLGVGINPHAPYSVGPELREMLRALLEKQTDVVCGWHLAETAEEEQLLAHGDGSIAQFLLRRGLPSPAQPMGEEAESCAAIRLLKSAGLLQHCDLAFHMNGARPADWSCFRAPRALVHCPGTHQYFNRPAFPMAEALAAGVNVCLGTDSMASSHTLSMLEVLRTAAGEFTFLSGAQLLDMVTSNPARSRAFANVAQPIGTIQPGFAADFVALTCDPKPSSSLRDMLCDSETRVSQVFVSGERVL